MMVDRWWRYDFVCESMLLILGEVPTKRLFPYYSITLKLSLFTKGGSTPVEYSVIRILLQIYFIGIFYKSDF